MRIFKVKWFARFARKERISDAALLAAIRRAEYGLVDADLGGHLIKQRVARAGQGRSGGYRTIIAIRTGQRAFYLYGFAKSTQADLAPDEEENYKAAAKRLLDLSEETLSGLVEVGALTEI